MKKLIALLLALVMVLALVACNGGTANDGTPSNNPSENPGNNQPSEQPPEVVDNGVVAESITIQIQDPETLSPFGGQSGGGASIKHAIFQPLGARDGFAGEFKSIMMDKWEKTGDRTWTVTIFDDIYDSEGNHITAEDVEFSWKECQRVGELTETFDVAEIKATGEFTVEFTWGADMSLGAFELQMANVLIVSKAAYEASSDQMAIDPIGTGPYKLQDYQTSSSVTLVINDNYWETEDQMDLPVEKHNVKTINYQVLAESSTITMALQAGTIDISEEVNNMDLVNFRDGGAYAENYNVWSQPKTSGLVLCMNADEASPLHDLNLRMAVAYAIDADFIAQSVNGGNNEVNYVLGGPLYLDYDNYFESIYHKYDLETAKQYMAQSEYPDGCTLKIIMISGNTNQVDTAQILKNQLEQIGINLEIDAQQFGNYIANEHDPAGWDFTICTFGSDDYLTNAWKKYFDTNATGTDTTKNFVKDEKLQQLIETCVSEDGHTAENIHAFWDYVNENAWIHGLIVENDNIVYNDTLISGIAWDNIGKLAPGGFSYVG